MFSETNLPGVVPAGGPEPKLEWVKPGTDLMGLLAVRLGSDARAESLLVAVLSALRDRIAADTWDGVLDEMPFPVRAVFRAPGQPFGRAGATGGDPVDVVARAVQHPRARARLEVAAVLDTLERTLPRGLAAAILQELPPDVARLWKSAR